MNKIKDRISIIFLFEFEKNSKSIGSDTYNACIFLNYGTSRIRGFSKLKNIGSRPGIYKKFSLELSITRGTRMTNKELIQWLNSYPFAGVHESDF